LQIFTLVNQEQQDIIDFIVLFNNIPEKIRLVPISSPLRFEFRHEILIDSEDIRCILRTKAGAVFRFALNYEHIGIEVTFQGKDWNDAQNPIHHIKIYNKTRIQQYCTLCLKNLEPFREKE
jgi:hypothetical protein